MHRPTLHTAAAISLVAGLSTLAHATVSTFDAGSEGWSVADTAGAGDYSTLISELTVNWQAAGGNPGGAIAASDTTNNTIMFRAPESYRGNRAAAAGFNLTFDITTTHASWTADTVVVLKGAGLTLVSEFALPMTDVWNSVTIPLVASSFRVNNAAGAVAGDDQFAALLADVDELWINAEYGNGLIETTRLDNVNFPVPAPSVLALAPVALALRRRR